MFKEQRDETTRCEVKFKDMTVAKYIQFELSMDVPVAMNRQQAFAVLQERIRARSPLTPAKCLFCHGEAHFSERATPTNLFCSTHCQTVIYALGVKRRGESIGDEKVDMPNEALDFIFTAAYRQALYSIEEYEELMSLRLVDKQFMFVIDVVVIPHIRFLCGAILRDITGEALLKFERLEKFVKTGNKISDSFGLKVRTRQIVTLEYLLELTIDYLQFTKNVDFSTLKRLEKLTLNHVTMTNQQVSSMKNLSSITITFCKGLDVSCFNGLEKLEEISLYNRRDARGMNQFRPLNQLKQLKSLAVDHCVLMYDSDINELTGLTSLSLPDGVAMDWDIDERLDPNNRLYRRITHTCLLNFPNLTNLALSNNDQILDLSWIDLPKLEKLDLSNRQDVAIDSLIHFKTLKSLNLSYSTLGFPSNTVLSDNFPELTEISLHNCYADGEYQSFTLPETVKTLSLSAFTKQHIVFTPNNITSLYICECSDFGVDDLMQYTQLEVLMIKGRSRPMGLQLLEMKNLRELCVIDNAQVIYPFIWRLNLNYLYLASASIRKESIAEMRKRGVIVFDKNGTSFFHRGDSYEQIDKRPPRVKQWL
jgi:hypothetical protein